MRNMLELCMSYTVNATRETLVKFHSFISDVFSISLIAKPQLANFLRVNSYDLNDKLNVNYFKISYSITIVNVNTALNGIAHVCTELWGYDL